jgi:formate--tetrahydrofolate ligase
MRPIEDVGGDLGFTREDLQPWGPGVAKIAPGAAFGAGPLQGKLVLVSAMSPTPAGEGKTTCVIGLTQAARRLGVRAACALREPSLGPVFGAKGGGTGGGRSMLVPSDRINLHFTGDIHAVAAANNLLAALVDNELYFDGPARLDSKRIAVRRVMDMNDRFLRHIVTGLGGLTMGVPREDGFDIAAASEVMAILCLAADYADLKARLGKMIVGFGRDGRAVRVADLRVEGAMSVLLRDAMLPNLVQTTEGAPALVHGGPFGNIAHGCNSIVATRLLLRRAEVVFTEAGFGFDLGAEKFLDIKCRSGGFWPHAIVIVVTLRAMKFHGGVPAGETGRGDLTALERGMDNLRKHLENVRQFGMEPIIVVNARADDRPDEIQYVTERIRGERIEVGVVEVFERGGDGGLEAAERILECARAAKPEPRYLYELAEPPAEKICRVARAIYGAQDVELSLAAKKQLNQIEALGLSALPVCIAKTHLSLSDDARLIGRPRSFDMTVREVRIAAGAGFLVPLAGDVTTMPGLPKRPHAADLDLLPDGTIAGMP